jgi:hypothetical protein
MRYWDWGILARVGIYPLVPQVSVVFDSARVSKKELSWFAHEFFAEWRWFSD